MSRNLDRVSDDASSTKVRTALRRLAVLLLLVIAAFRSECREVIVGSMSFSEWSHVMALPIVVGAFCWLRRNDLQEAITDGSNGGLILMVVGAFIWFATRSLGLFGYLTLVAMLITTAGAVLTVCGARVIKIGFPVLLMAATCLPLSERSMERFSVATQRASLFAAVTMLKAVPGLEVSTHGTTIAYQHGTSSGEFGLGEQRFAFRLIFVGFMIGLLVVFSRRRPPWQIILLVLTSVPLVLISNVLRMIAASLVTVYGNGSPVSNIPRNVSIVVGLVTTYLLFYLMCGLLNQITRLGALFYVEDDSNSDSLPVERSAS